MAASGRGAGGGHARAVRLEEYASTGAAPAVHTSSSTNSSNAHRLNDKYMESFDAAFEELHRAAGGSSSSARKTTATRAGTPLEGKCESMFSSDERAKFQRAAAVGELDGAWLRGPAVPEGALHTVSAQPLMCMSMSADAREVVVGSSDHALYVIPLRSIGGGATGSRGSRSLAAANASKPRTLYSKKFGHAEWVTCVTHLPDNRVVSGGMDSKLCLWDATGVKCEDLLGHSGSVSLVQSFGGDLLASAGYDKTVRVWNTSKHASNRQRERSSIKAASAPILDASLMQDSRSLVCGDRDGSVHVVNLEDEKVVKKLVGAHKGHTTSVLGNCDDEANAFYTGGQDGVVKVWDVRQSNPLHSLTLHVDARSGKSGAVGFIRKSPEDANVLVTGGADGTIKVLDKRASFSVLHKFTEHMDFIYSLQLHGQLCLSGAGNGMLHVHDWKRGKLLYGLGANQAAVRAIAATPTQLVAAGDDGGVVIYDME